MNIYAENKTRLCGACGRVRRSRASKLKESNMKYNDYMSKVQICAERMKTLRKEHGLTMNELAEEIGMAPCNVFYYEHIKHVPNIITLIKYAMYFGVSTDYLLGMDEQDNEDKYRSYQAMIMVWADRAASGRYDGNDELVRDVIAFAKTYGLARKDKEK